MKNGRELKKAVIYLSRATFTPVNYYLELPFIDFDDYCGIIAEMNKKIYTLPNSFAIFELQLSDQISAAAIKSRT